MAALEPATRKRELRSPSRTPSAMTSKDWASNFWITLVDENGESFYANPATGERRWELEPGRLVLPASADGQWYEVWSDEHNLPYYFHTKTQETRWYRPEGFIVPLKAVQRFSAGKRFSLSLDSGRPVTPIEPESAPSDEDIQASAVEDSRDQDKPLPGLPASDSFELLARSLDNSGLSDRDAVDAALLQCMELHLSIPASAKKRKKPSSPIRRNDADRLPSESSFYTAIDTSSKMHSPTHSSAKVGKQGVRASFSSGVMLARLSDSSDEYIPQSATTTDSSMQPSSPASQWADDWHTIAVPGLAEPFVQDLPSPTLSHRRRSKPLSGLCGSDEAFASSPNLAGIAYQEPLSPRSTTTPHRAKLTKTPPSKSPKTKTHSPIGRILAFANPHSNAAKKRNIGFPIQQDPGHQQSLPSSPVVGSPKLGSMPRRRVASYGTSRYARDVTAATDASEDHTLDHYAQQHFATRPRSKFLVMAGMTQHPLRWQFEDLNDPILTIPKQLRWDALQCFTHIQHIMGDKRRDASALRLSSETISAPSAWDTTTIEEARKLLAIGLGLPELRDEVYIQLMCQVTDNPSVISAYRGWQLLQVLLITVPPSPLLEPVLRQFLIGKLAHSSKSRLGIIARFALTKLNAIIAKGPRGKVPGAFEVAASSEAAFQPTVFGETLQRIMSLQATAYPDVKVPIILPFLADGIIALGGLKKFGLFRHAADSERVNELRLTIDQGKYSFIGFEDAHVAASLFKLWLRELATPLIPPEFYDDCLAAGNDSATAITIVQSLPTLNRRIVSFIISFVQLFLQKEVSLQTMVSSESLAMIFAPSILRCPALSEGPAYEVIVNNTRREQQFVHCLLHHLEVRQLNDDEDWVPTHGKSLSASTASSSTFSDPSRSSLSDSVGSGGTADTSGAAIVEQEEKRSSSESSLSSQTVSVRSATTSPQKDGPAAMSAGNSTCAETFPTSPVSSHSDRDPTLMDTSGDFLEGDVPTLLTNPKIVIIEVD